jgi:2-polyprenyl-6-methoxyphenol hydroxylase-like FAD-dependent oxidoreductase/pimeloyl-ACP methyl ester carboxylesterase
MLNRVIIVGAGPTGLTAALELSRFGVPVRIIDKQAAPATTSRAVGVQARTLELFELRGLADEMVRLGNPGPAASIYAGGKRVLRLDFTRIDSRYHYSLFISQAETERILRTALERLGVRIERGVELVGLAQDVLSPDPNPVRVVLRHADGRLEQAQTPWLISAEGAHSTVRATLDLPFEGHTREEQYALGDVHVEGELAETDAHIFSAAQAFMSVFPMGHRRFRVIAANALSRASKDAAPALAELQAIYDQRSPIPARFRDMSWSSWFRINSRIAARLRVGRLLLGGDAAHIHAPAGAQGMNTGIQDMINLAWKLALVAKGQAPLALLDTYEQERLPVMRDVLAKTDALTDTVLSEKQVGPWAQHAEKAQDAIANQITQLAIGYRNSPLSASHVQEGLHAGDRMPDLPVRHRSEGGAGWQEGPLFRLLDPSRFSLLVVRFAESAAAPADVYEAVQPWCPLIGMVEVAPAPKARERFQAVFGRSDGVFLVRPDGYVGFASGKHASARQLDAYCRQWLGAPKPVKQTFRADDALEIVGDICGEGDTALVFLHGWCGDREYWKHQIGPFAADYRVVALDQAGHGESGKDRKAWTVASLAGDIEAVVKTLGLKRVILVGHSIGGPIALLAAKRMPGTVVAVIGIDTLHNAESQIPEEVRTKFLAGFEKDFRATMRVVVTGMVHETTGPELTEWLVRRAELQDPRMGLPLMRDLFDVDTVAAFKQASVPVRCINSAGGYQFFTPTAVETNRKYADFGAVTIEGVGHYPMLEKPDEFNRRLRDVLKEFATKTEPVSPGMGKLRKHKRTEAAE